MLRDVTDAEEVLHRLHDVIEHEVEVSGLPLSVESSIGFVIAPDDGANVEELLQYADVAMYVAKAQHASVVRYEAGADHYDAANLALISCCARRSTGASSSCTTSRRRRRTAPRVEAIEALVRWQHPTLGLLYPDRFIPLAEQTDLIDKLTDWVMKTALTAP